MSRWIVGNAWPAEAASFVRRSRLPASGIAAENRSGRLLLLRGVLLLGCAAAIGIAGCLGDPNGYLSADPPLARLLRGMALIKALIAVAAVGAVMFRIAWPVTKPVAAAYLIGCWAMSASTMLIWELSYIVPAALLFHGAALSLLWVSWQER